MIYKFDESNKVENNQKDIVEKFEKVKLEIDQSIKNFENCRLIDDAFYGPTIVFYYHGIRVKFFKNTDGFGGKKGGITCSLNRFNPNARARIYKKIEETPNLIWYFENYLEIE